MSYYKKLELPAILGVEWGQALVVKLLDLLIVSFVCIFNLNKDHQRIMVDPMFMIVQSLRSFLAAVTTTAVAPIAVILPVFT